MYCDASTRSGCTVKAVKLVVRCFLRGSTQYARFRWARIGPTRVEPAEGCGALRRRERHPALDREVIGQIQLAVP